MRQLGSGDMLKVKLESFEKLKTSMEAKLEEAFKDAIESLPDGPGVIADITRAVADATRALPLVKPPNATNISDDGHFNIVPMAKAAALDTFQPHFYTAFGLACQRAMSACVQRNDWTHAGALLKGDADGEETTLALFEMGSTERSEVETSLLHVAVTTLLSDAAMKPHLHASLAALDLDTMGSAQWKSALEALRFIASREAVVA